MAYKKVKTLGIKYLSIPVISADISGLLKNFWAVLALVDVPFLPVLAKKKKLIIFKKS